MAKKRIQFQDEYAVENCEVVIFGDEEQEEYDTLMKDITYPTEEEESDECEGDDYADGYIGWDQGDNV